MFIILENENGNEFYVVEKKEVAHPYIYLPTNIKKYFDYAPIPEYVCYEYHIKYHPYDIRTNDCYYGFETYQHAKLFIKNFIMPYITLKELTKCL